MELTIEILNDEHSAWTQANGSGRDKDDQRFGQYIWNKYDLDKFFPERNSGLDGFADERPNLAYFKIAKAILLNEK